MFERKKRIWYYNQSSKPASQSGTIKLLDLPNELLIHIGLSFEHPKDLFSLLQANRHLSILLPPTLKRLAAAHGHSTVLRILHTAITRNQEELQSILSTGSRATILDKRDQIIHTVPSRGNTEHIIAHAATIAICLKDSANKIYTGTGLHWAVKSGRVDLARKFLEAGADLELMDSERKTPLDVAAAEGNAELVRALLRKGADRSSRPRFGNTPLHRARDKTHMEAFEALLEDRADIRYKDGAHLIHVVAAHPFGDDVDAIKTLLQRGAKITDKDNHNRTALHFAASAGNKNILQLLLKAGADPNDMTAPTSTITLACKGGHIAVANTLFNTASLSFRDRENRSPLHLAIEHLYYDDMVPRLLQRGFSPNARDSAGATPLHMAAAAGNTRLSALLLDHGADVNARDNSARTPLHRAAARRGRDSEDVVGLLIGSGADVTALDNGGMTPLQLAAEKKDEGLVRLLIHAGPA